MPLCRPGIMALSLAVTAAASGAVSNTTFPEGMLGIWTPKLGSTPQSILGPLSYEFLAGSAGGFQALRDESTGDVWFTLLMGQAFRVSGDQMQYCFSGDVAGSNQSHGTLMEQSPFSVAPGQNETFIRFCWRTGLKGMPTHTANCT